MQKFFSFFTSKTFFANIVLAIIVGLLFIWGISIFLNSYTHHGQKIVVPNLAYLSLEEAGLELQNKDLGFEVIDSAEFNDLFPPLAVIEQFPVANAEVKQGRVIMLTINPAKARRIELPNIIEKTLRRAIHDLETRHLVVGELIYVPDIAQDVIIGMQINNEEVEPGIKIEKETIIDLIVGQGISNKRVIVPYLKYLTLEPALDKMKLSSLNLGIVFYDADLTDTANAIIYRQSPAASKTPYIKLGSSIDLWLTNNNNKVLNDSLDFMPQLDSAFVDSNNVVKDGLEGM